MGRTLSKSQFKPRALEHFREVERTGEELIITDRGRPVLKIVPYEQNPAVALSGFRGLIRRYDDPLEPVGQDDWEALE